MVEQTEAAPVVLAEEDRALSVSDQDRTLTLAQGLVVDGAQLGGQEG